MKLPSCKFRLNIIALVLLLSLPLPALATVTIDNGLPGDGFWSVVVDDAGDSRNGTIDPNGANGPSNVIFFLGTFYDNGLDGDDGLLSAGTTSPATLTNPGEVTSSGTFPGPNGTVNWTSVSTIAPGSPLYVMEFQFSSSSPFGATRIINYFDEDVLTTQNIGVVLGTDGGADFLLLTVHPTENIGVSHAAGYLTASNMTYAGWAMAHCCGAPSVYSINPGQTGGLPSTTDPRFPADPVYGVADITSSFAFDFDPSATTASVTFVLGGSADAAPPQVRRAGPIPLLSFEGLLAMVLIMLSVGLVGLRNRARQS